MAKRAKLDDEVFEEVFDDSIEENEGSEDDNESHHSSVPSDMVRIRLSLLLEWGWAYCNSGTISMYYCWLVGRT